MLLHTLQRLKRIIKIIRSMRLRRIRRKMTADNFIFLHGPQRLRQRTRHLRHLPMLRSATILLRIIVVKYRMQWHVAQLIDVNA